MPLYLTIKNLGLGAYQKIGYVLENRLMLLGKTPNEACPCERNRPAYCKHLCKGYDIAHMARTSGLT